jgi:hypothetical protein
MQLVRSRWFVRLHQCTRLAPFEISCQRPFALAVVKLPSGRRTTNFYRTAQRRERAELQHKHTSCVCLLHLRSSIIGQILVFCFLDSFSSLSSFALRRFVGTVPSRARQDRPVKTKKSTIHQKDRLRSRPRGNLKEPTLTRPSATNR